MVDQCGVNCSKCGINERIIGSSWCSNCINTRKRALRAEKKAKGIPLFGSNANPICNLCGSNKEPNYMNDSLCKKCRSDANKLSRQQKRVEEGKSLKGSGRSMYCSTCKIEKEPGRENESRCKKCKSDAYKARNAAKREDLGLKPWGSGRKETCSDCGQLKENINIGYCNSCHRKRDREWRLATGRTKRARTGKCRCGQPFASYSHCYCVDCASKWRREYLARRPDIKDRFNKQHNEKRRKDPNIRLKEYVRGITNTYIKNGWLIRQPCEICKTDINVEAHHDDYSKPIDVRWLCKLHHAEHHKNEKK